MSFVIAVAVGLLSIPLARRLSSAVGLVDRPDGDGLKIHRGPVPLCGGLVIAAASSVALLASGSFPVPVVAAAAVSLVTGLWDDFRPLSPRLRLLLLAVAGATLSAGTELELLGSLGGVATIFLVIACSNAVNLVDGQDGLAGGLGIASSLGLTLIAALHGDPAGMDLGLALTGALVAFLVWNRPPARIFLGNGGAYALGTLLAAAALQVANQGGWRTLLAAGICLAVFAFELSFTVVRRVLAGRRLTVGDRLHSYDILTERTGKRDKVTAAFCLVSTVVAAFSYLVAVLPLALGIATFVTLTGAAALGALRLRSL